MSEPVIEVDIPQRPGSGRIRRGHMARCRRLPTVAAHNWNESTLDERRGIIYIPFGTARFDFYGGNRHGDKSVRQQPRRARCAHGKTTVAFSSHPPRCLGLRPSRRAQTTDDSAQPGRNVDAVAQRPNTGSFSSSIALSAHPYGRLKSARCRKLDVPGEQTSKTQPFPTAPPPACAAAVHRKGHQLALCRKPNRRSSRDRLRNSRNEGIVHPTQSPRLDPGAGMERRRQLGESLRGEPGQGHDVRQVSKEFPSHLKIYHPRDVPLWRRPASRSPANVAAARCGTGLRGTTHPHEWMLSESNGLPLSGPPWSQLTAYDLNKGTSPLADSKRRGRCRRAEPARGRRSGSAGLPRGGPVAHRRRVAVRGDGFDRKLRVRPGQREKCSGRNGLPAASEGAPARLRRERTASIVAIPVGGAGFMPVEGSSVSRPPGRVNTWCRAAQPTLAL